MSERTYIKTQVWEAVQAVHECNGTKVTAYLPKDGQEITWSSGGAVWRFCPFCGAQLPTTIAGLERAAA